MIIIIIIIIIIKLFVKGNISYFSIIYTWPVEK